MMAFFAGPVRAGAPGPRSARGPAACLAAALLLAVLSGCAGSRLDVPEFQAQVARGEYGSALAALEAAGDQDDVAAMLDRGLLLSALGRYDESNAVFDAAELKIDDLYTRSLSKEALSLLTNDRALDYRASGYEHGFIAYYRAWNYLEQGAVEGALVEARKINERLNFRSDTCADQDGACGHDAFLRYFSGLVFEWGGELNDAYVAYKQADIAAETMQERFGVPPPPDLGERLVRLARFLGFSDEAALHAERYGVDAASLTVPAPGRVVAVLENGMVGRRRQVSLTIPILKGERKQIAGDVDGWSHRLASRRRETYRKVELDYLLHVAIPEYVEIPPAGRRSEFTLGATAKGSAQPVENLSAMARTALDDAMPGILARTIARALTKYLAQETAEKEIGKGAGLLVNLLGAAMESADTRAWRALPHEIQIAVVEAPPGTYEGRLVVFDAAGAARDEVRYPELTVEPGGIRFVRHRTGG